MTEPNSVALRLEKTITENFEPLAKTIAEASHIPGAQLESIEIHAKKIEQSLSQYMMYAKRRCKEGFCCCLDALKRLAITDMASVEEKIHEAFMRFDTEERALDMAKQATFGSSWKEILGLDDSILQELYNGAKNLYDVGRFPEAEAAFFFLTTVDSKQYIFWLGLGHAAFRLGNLNQAINAYESAESVQPGLIWPHIYIANCFEAMGDTEEVRAALHQAEEEFQKSNSQDEELRLALTQRIKRVK